jgi:LmbE family N-acetylglucosaminyl deacetylase
MGFQRLSMLDRTQGSLSLEETEMAAALERILRETRPDQIFCPFVADHHRDHAAVAIAVADAIEQSGWRGEVWCYEVWSPLWPNVAVDVTDVIDIKRHALELYASQSTGLHYPDGILGLNRYRALRVDVGYAETFFVSDEAGYVEVSRLMNEL